MTREQSLQIIRDAFSHVEVDRIVVTCEPILREDVARIYVVAEDLEAAFGEDGLYPREVAMNAGISIEIVLLGRTHGSDHLGAHNV